MSTLSGLILEPGPADLEVGVLEVCLEVLEVICHKYSANHFYAVTYNTVTALPIL